MTIIKMLYVTGMLALVAGVPSRINAQQNELAEPSAVTTTTVTSVTGTILQLNYGSSGAVEGFLLNATTLLTFPTNITGGIGTLGAVGNSVTYSGTAVTTTAGFEAVRVSTFTNNTTKVTYTATTTTVTATAYGPTSGTVKQLNYDTAGDIDGFLFTPAGSTTALLVSTNAQASATLQPLLAVGVTISVIGSTFTQPVSTACVATSTLTAVNASSLVIGGHTIVIASGGGNGGNRGGGNGGGPGRP